MVSSTATSCGTTVATMTRPVSYGTPAARRPASKVGGGGSARSSARLALRVVEHGAVLGHDEIEEVDLRADGEEVLEAPAGDEQNAPAGFPYAAATPRRSAGAMAPPVASVPS